MCERILDKLAFSHFYSDLFYGRVFIGPVLPFTKGYMLVRHIIVLAHIEIRQ